MIELKAENGYAVVVLTPFQYINVLEYLYQNNVDKKECILILISHLNKSVRQIQDIGFTNEFSSLHMPMIGNKNIWLRFLRTYLLLNKYLYLTPIVGNINNNWSAYLIQKSKSAITPIIVDDGAATLPLIKKRNLGDFTIPQPKSNSKIGLFQMFFLKTNNQIKKKLTFFTIFKSLKGKNYDNVEMNCLELLKNNYGLISSSLMDEIWFIGSPFVQLGMISYRDYEIVINKIVSYSHKMGIKLKYFNHRIEKGFLFEGAETVNNNTPFEIFYLNSKRKPKYIIGFYSTSLFALAAMNVPSSLISIYFDQNVRQKGDWKSIDLVYDAIENEDKIKLVNIKDLNNL